MRLLTLDRGNSTLDVMLHRDDGASTRLRLVPADSLDLGTFLGADQPDAAVGLSTVPSGLDGLRARLLGRGLCVMLAGQDLPCPIPTRYRDPRTLGVDRWVGALAAFERFGAALTVDCGTALTVNAIAADGTFLGGVIAPGARSLARGLARVAPALPEADPRRAGLPGLPATTSQDAVDAGVVLGFVGLVERLTTEVAQAAGLSGVPLVLTGGEAPLVLAHGRLGFEHVDDLVHQGLRCLWRRHLSRS